MTTNERVSRELRAHMARRSLTASDLAHALDLSPAAVSRRLTGNVEWTVGELSSVCDLLSVPMADLLRDAA